MRLTRVRFILLATVFGFSALYLLLGFLGPAPLGPTPVMAEEPSISICWPCFTDTLTVEIQDLSGNVIGEGEHVGSVSCRGSICNQKTEIYPPCPPLTYPPGYGCLMAYDFEFRTLQSVDPVAKSFVVTGGGSLSTGAEIESFTFVVTFQDNRDGTVSAKYELSIPEYSVLIPRTPGTIEFDSQ